MPDETIETTQEDVTNEVAETTAAVDSELGDLLGDVSGTEETPVESQTDPAGSDTVTGFPDDYLDTSTFNAGVEQILSAIEGEEEMYTGSGAAVIADGSVELPWNAVTFLCEGQEILFPSDYAQEVYVEDGELINVGSSYTFGVVLGDSGLSNYISSEVTVPTYHSSTWYQYLYNYGQPYRIVDRYVNNYGSYSSNTRTSVDLEFSGGNDWSGWDYGILIAFVIMLLIILREVRTWLS